MEVNLNWETKTPAEAAEAFRSLPDVLSKKLESAADDIGVQIRSDAEENVTTDRTRLRDSLTSIVEAVGTAIINIKVGSNVEHAAPQEFGTEPFFPPPSELRGWARRQLGAEDPESAAFLVARSISETGIEAQHYLRDALQDNLEWAVERIRRAVEAAFSEVGFSV